MRWTESDDAKLAKMFADGDSREAMGRELGRTGNAVRGRLSRLGLTALRWSAGDIDWLRDFYAKAEGRPIDLRIAEVRLGRDRTNICRKARELGLPVDQARPKFGQMKLPKAPQTSAMRSERARRALRQHGHPRGMAGKTHTAETKKAIGEQSRAAWADPNSGHNTPEATERRVRQFQERIRRGERLGRNGHTRCRGGKRADLGGQYFRSAWEANYARYLNWLVEQGGITSWRYEVKTFEFPVKRGPAKFYTPDFEVTRADGGKEWHEVKGWMDGPSKTRLRRMAKHYPDEVVLVIDKRWFRGANKRGLPDIIPHWEKGTTR